MGGAGAAANALGGSGSGGAKAGSGGTGSSTTSIPDCLTTLFRGCGKSGCHSAGLSQVDLASSGVEKRLVGVDTPSTSLACKGRKLVTTDGSPSLLLEKIAEATPPCGTKMPLDGTQLSADDLKCVSDWVDTVSTSDVGGP